MTEKLRDDSIELCERLIRALKRGLGFKHEKTVYIQLRGLDIDAMEHDAEEKSR